MPKDFVFEPSHVATRAAALSRHEDRPERFESVLSNDWNQPPRTVRIGESSIDEHRMQRLSQLARTQVRSLWMDLLTIVVAVLIGIGIGVVILGVWFPDLIETHLPIFDLVEGK